MRSVEFAAELTILLIEGPQDKKVSIDLYYGRYQHKFSDAGMVSTRLHNYLAWIVKALPSFSTTRFRKPVDLYSLIGALDRASDQGNRVSKIAAAPAGEKLLQFEKKTRQKAPTDDAGRYVAAASRQTDNLIPRSTRIDILGRLLS